MELERGHIQKRDFPQARKGYDPDAVDSHLRAIADAVDQLKSAQPAQASLAGAAASRVESIVAAAEASAREIEERAKADAAQIRERAERDATARVSGGQEAVDRLVEAAQALHREMEDMLRRATDLKAGVDAIQADVDSAARTAESAPAAAAPSIDPKPAPEAPVPVIEPEPEPDPEPEPEPEPKPSADDGRASEGARLIALNMALSGTPREETARYLRENFDLDGQDSLLDEVYAKVGS